MESEGVGHFKFQPHQALRHIAGKVICVITGSCSIYTPTVGNENKRGGISRNTCIFTVSNVVLSIHLTHDSLHISPRLVCGTLNFVRGYRLMALHTRTTGAAPDLRTGASN